MDRDYINNINLPKNIDSVIDNAISRGERKKRKKKNIAKVAAVAILISSVTLFNLTSQSFADNIPFLGKVFENVTLKDPGQNNNYNNYAEGINALQSDGNTSIKIDQAVCDGNFLFLSAVINSKDGFKENKKSNDLDSQIFSGGLARVDFEDHYEDDYSKDLENKFAENKSGYKGLFTTQGFLGKFVDKNTFIGIAKYELKQFNREIPDKFKVKLNFNNINYDFSEKHDDATSINGNWNFEFEVTKISSSDIKTIVPTFKNEDITVDKITLTPLSTTITFSISKELEKKIEIPRIFDENNIEVPGFTSTAPALNKENRIVHTCSYAKFPEGSKNMKIKVFYDSKDFITIPLTQN